MPTKNFSLILDNLLTYSLYVLIFFIPISKAAIEISVGAAALFYILKLIQTRDASVLKSKSHVLLSVFFLACTFSLFVSGEYFGKSLNSLILKWGEYLLVFLMVSDVFRDSKKRNIALQILVWTSVLIALDGFFQYFAGVDFLRHKPLGQMTLSFSGAASQYLLAITASFYHYNDLGTYLFAMLLISICYWMSESRLRVKRFSLLGIFLLSLALLLTFSRASWLNFIIGCFLIAVLTKKYKLLIFLGFFTFFILLIPPFNHRFFYTFQSAFGGLSSRQEIWNLAWKMIGESPILGKGVGTFMDYSLAYSGGKNATYTHNCFLQIWAETGIIALLAFLLFSVSLLLKGWSVFKRSRNFQLLGWGCAFFTLLLASFLDTQLYSLQLSAFFWTVAGLLFAACQTN